MLSLCQSNRNAQISLWRLIKCFSFSKNVLTLLVNSMFWTSLCSIYKYTHTHTHTSGPLRWMMWDHFTSSFTLHPLMVLHETLINSRGHWTHHLITSPQDQGPPPDLGKRPNQQHTGPQEGGEFRVTRWRSAASLHAEELCCFWDRRVFF